MTRKSGAGGRNGRLPLRLFAGFFLWGIALSVLQGLLEPTVLITAPTVWLVRGMRWALPLLGVPTSVDGTTLAFLGTAQEITPNCLGLAVIAAYAAAVLGTPATWRSRARALVVGLVAISAVNVVRLLALGGLLTASVAAYQFAHIAVWGALAPLFLLGVWGLWAVRDLQFLPAYPLRLLMRVAIAVPVLLVAWHFVRDAYLILVTVTVNAVLTAVGAPVRGVSLVQVEQYRYLDVAFATGAMRLEGAAVSVTLVAFLALVIATAASVSRRFGVALGGLAALFGLQVAGASAVLFLGMAAPGAALPLETFVDLLSLSVPVVLWLSAFGPLLAWRGASRVRSRPPDSRRESREMGPPAIPSGRG